MGAGLSDPQRSEAASDHLLLSVMVQKNPTHELEVDRSQRDFMVVPFHIESSTASIMELVFRKRELILAPIISQTDS
jgi:hypothetical protein